MSTEYHILLFVSVSVSVSVPVSEPGEKSGFLRRVTFLVGHCLERWQTASDHPSFGHCLRPLQQVPPGGSTLSTGLSAGKPRCNTTPVPARSDRIKWIDWRLSRVPCSAVPQGPRRTDMLRSLRHHLAAVSSEALQHDTTRRLTSTTRDMCFWWKKY